MTSNRFVVRVQSTTCPDGYDRNLYYVWDRLAERIVDTSTDRDDAHIFTAESSTGSSDVSITITDRLDHTMSLRDIDEIVQALAHERDAIRWLSNKVGRAESNEEWPSYAWPGGYTIVYLLTDGDDLCVGCMNNPDNPVRFTGPDDGWKVVSAYLAEENDREPGEQIACAHCGAVIYTEPEE